MISKRVIGFFLVSFIVVSLAACSKYQRLLKSADYDLKFQTAEKYYNQGDYYRAVQLLDELISVYRGTERAEKVYYYYAYCHFYQEDYILGSYYFKQFYTFFPKSPLAEECMFKAAYCKYLDSPGYSLDQTSTYEALKEMQLFVNTYPKSEKIAECNELIDKLRYKLETKEFEIAVLYYKTEDYKAALTTFANVLKDFPDTKYREESMFYIFKASFLYAFHSVDSKKQERFEAAINAYNSFIASYPNSIFLEEANDLFSKSSSEIKKIAKHNTL